MPNFEVHIPAAPGGFNTTLKVSADNWMAALKAGLQKLGEQGSSSQNVMVDIQDDNSIHVTDSSSGRVFRIRELSDEEAARAAVKRPSRIMVNPTYKPLGDNDKTLVPGQVFAPTDMTKTIAGTPPGVTEQVENLRATTPGIVHKDVKTELMPATTPSSEAKTEPPPSKSEPEKSEKDKKKDKKNKNKKEEEKKEEKAAEPFQSSPSRIARSSPRVDVGLVEELEAPLKPVAGNIGRPKTTPDQAAAQKQQIDDMLADIFLQVNELQEKASIEDAMEFVLDLAMSKVPCESGSVLRADGASGDLTFIVARGPKAKEVMKAKFVVPAGTGFAGFCAAEGVSVAVSDAEKDPRFYAEVGAKVDFTTKSILCAPMMTHGRSFGCVQLINRRGGGNFLEHEVGVLAYLSHQGALYLNTHV